MTNTKINDALKAVRESTVAHAELLAVLNKGDVDRIEAEIVAAVLPQAKLEERARLITILHSAKDDN